MVSLLNAIKAHQRGQEEVAAVPTTQQKSESERCAPCATGALHLTRVLRGNVWFGAEGTAKLQDKFMTMLKKSAGAAGAGAGAADSSAGGGGGAKVRTE